jgi:hypothetical protein
MPVEQGFLPLWATPPGATIQRLLERQGIPESSVRVKRNSKGLLPAQSP